MKKNNIETKIKYTFKDKSLLSLVFRHCSVAVKEYNIDSNERLEFLGDSVLGFIIAEYLYEKYPDLPEGHLSKIRASLVCTASLAKAAEQLKLIDSVVMSEQEERAGGRIRNSVKENTFEALVGAIYLDGGIKAAKSFIFAHLDTDIDPWEMGRHMLGDYKTELQELVQQTPGDTIAYRVLDVQGPAHAQDFTCEVLINDKPMGKGTAQSKKAAEQAAAKVALEKLNPAE
jgi:ribonuclease III, bacterial